MDPLLATLRKVRWLLGVQQWIRFAAAGLIGALAGCCAWLVLTRLFPLLAVDRTPHVGILAIGVLASLLWAIRRRPSLLQAASRPTGGSPWMSASPAHYSSPEPRDP